MPDVPSQKKPRSSIPFLPDPTKWIQTSSSASSTSSSAKKAVQRPLVSFKNAFATPPTTIRRRPADEDITPSAESNRQKSLNGFLTPPPTRKPRETDRSSTRPIRSRLAVRLDDSDSEGARPRITPLQSHRSAPVTSSSSGMSDAVDQPSTPPRHRRRRHRTSSPPPSSDHPVTPVPAYVLDIHRRLCGRDTQRMKGVRSPWRKDGSPRKMQSPMTADKRKKHEVDERAHDQALVKRRKRQDKENEMRLVGSSQADPSTSNKPDVFSPRRVDIREKHEVDERPYDQPLVQRRKRQDKENGRRLVGSSQPSPKKIDVLSPRRVNIVEKRAPRGHEGIKRRRTVDHDESIPDADPITVYQAFRAPSPRIRTPPKLRRLPTGSSPKSAIPLGSPTPVKAERASPPANLPYELPEDDSPNPASPSDHSLGFKPVPMQAETLMTWSLGPQPLPQAEGEYTSPQRYNAAVSARQVASDAKSPRCDDRALAEAPEGSVETQSLAPSNASQSFPNLFPSPSRSSPTRPQRPLAGSSIVLPKTAKLSTKRSPTGKKRSLASFPTDQGVAETVLPARTDTSDAPKEVKRPRTTGWPSTGFGGPSAPHPTSSPSKITPAKRDSQKTPRPHTTQSHLAQFGFFNDRPTRTVKGFDQAWDDEEDIPLDAEDDDHAGLAPSDSQTHLAPVPPPPPHPHLRPAGLRELERRRLAASSSQPEVTDHSSSLTTDDDIAAGVMNASAAAWWEGLDDRRSSEFGSIP